MVDSKGRQKEAGYKSTTSEERKANSKNHEPIIARPDRPYRDSGGRRRRRPAALDPGLVLAVLHRGDAPLARNRLDQAQLPLAMHDLEIPSAAVKR